MADAVNPMPGMDVKITVQGESLPRGGNPGDVLTKTEGGSTWEHVDVASSWDDLKDKPFYSTEPLRAACSNSDFPIVLYKVSSEVPDVGNLNVGDTVHLWEYYRGDVSDDSVSMIENGIYVIGEAFCVYVTDDNSSITISRFTISFPERGVYFGVLEGEFKIIGASLANADEPEISWDGNVGEIHTLDAKYLPDIPAEKLPDTFDLVVKLSKFSEDNLIHSTQTLFSFSNVTYAKLLEAAKKGKLILTSTTASLSCIPYKIDVSSEGHIFVNILIYWNGYLYFIALKCNPNGTYFYRNNWFKVAMESGS